ncbi:MAG: hypothetical protein PHV82_04065 [Victivallaceae bacterium]|nr:hypothetical protein [Victivallaceae bacterium]
MPNEQKTSADTRSFFVKKRFFALVMFFMTLMIGLIWGLFMHKYKFFPYYKLKDAYKSLPEEKAYGPWSIGIYEGSSPFALKAAAGISNPVLTGRKCGDALYVADPFMIEKDGRFFMFFEAMNRADHEGDIAFAESSDLKNWKYGKIILNEKFHLSFPNVFKWKGEYYLVPESHQDLTVRLYKAEKFPDKWKYVGNLISGYSFVDPAIFRYNNKWWLFITTQFSNILNLYYADSLEGKWKPHPMNPIIKFNAHISRPGGRVIIYKGRPYRFAQDCDPCYGIQVFAFEITELTETAYSEKPVSARPLLAGSGRGWNAAGMHHVDLHKIGNKWIAAVDGRDGEDK